MITLPQEKVREILTAAGIINEDTFQTLLKEAEHKRQNIVDLLISQNLISKDYYISLVAREFGVERVNLLARGIDENLLNLLPEEVARQKKAIVFGREQNGALSVAMEDPTNLEIVDYLSLRLSAPLKTYLATEDELNRGFSLYEAQRAKDFKQVIDESIKESLRLGTKGDPQKAATELPIVAVVDNLLVFAVTLRASDVHFEVLDDLVLVRYRIDGMLREVIRMPKSIHPAIVARIKIISELRVDEHNRPQDGRFKQKIGDQMIDIRVSILPTYYGEKIVLRLLTSSQKPLSFNELGIFGANQSILKSAISKTYGMVLVCGPTGSGKTTTLYTVLNMLNRPEVNIITVEDPIEYDMRYVNQVQVNSAAGITFSSGLRSILRQDPNIIMVGEIRDGDTANIAVQAALTGHLVLSTIHTNDALTAIPRLVDMGVPPFLVAVVVNTVSSQRLTRRIHLNCITSYLPSQDILDGLERQYNELGIPQEKRRLPKTLYRGKGCNTCGHTGYEGRIGIYEMLDVTEEIRALIISRDFNLDKLKAMARSQGMVSMFEDGMEKIERGLTTVEEVMRVVRE